MAWLEVTADKFDWNVPDRNGRVVLCFRKGLHEVTRQCLADAIAVGAGRAGKRPVKRAADDA